VHFGAVVRLGGYVVFSPDPHNFLTASGYYSREGHIDRGALPYFHVKITGVYLAPDVVPQGRTASRYAVDLGAKKAVQHGKGELFFNAADLFNTLRIEREITTGGVRPVGIDLYETQIIRVGYSYKF